MTKRSLHVGIVVERRYLTQAQPAGMITALENQGHNIIIIDAREVSLHKDEQERLQGLDIIVARGRSWSLLCLLRWAEALGIPTINRRASIAAVLNKAEVVINLSNSNFNFPHSFLGSISLLKNKVPLSSYPLIIKPLFGDNCRGLHIISSPDKLNKMTWPEPLALAQQYLPNDDRDLKLYGIGSEIWAVRKPSPLHKDKGGSLENCKRDSMVDLLRITRGLQKLGRACGNLFDLDLFGVDCIATQQGPVIVDVNDFPNYTGVPNADQKLAEYVIRSVERKKRKRKT